MEEYRIIPIPKQGLFKDKGSKFIARIGYVETEEDCKTFLTAMKKEYHDARHHCYAYRINPEDEQSRSSDDGEPAGTAGKPILNQILSHELYNIIIVVIRYFGGTKLGTSGLIAAYKTAARDAIMLSKIETRYVERYLELNFAYPLMNDIMRIIKEEKATIADQFYENECVIKLTVKKSNLERFLIRLKKVRQVEINVLKGK